MDFFGIGILEIGVILVVALLVLGPNQLPQVARKLGSVLGQARKTIAETRDTFLIDLDEQRQDGKSASGPASGANKPEPVESGKPG